MPETKYFKINRYGPRVGSYQNEIYAEAFCSKSLTSLSLYAPVSLCFLQRA